MRILAIDPGTEQSGVVLHETPRRPVTFLVLSNNEIAQRMIKAGTRGYKHLAIELFACYGAPVGDESIETVIWTGRFAQIALQVNKVPVTYIFRRTVAGTICHSGKAGDPEINTQLRNIYGKPGTKKEPGILYGIKSHAWAALAVATAWEDLWETGELDYLTLLPDGTGGATWKGQAQRDKIADLKKAKKAKARDKRISAKELQEEFEAYNINHEQRTTDWQTRAGA